MGYIAESCWGAQRVDSANVHTYKFQNINNGAF